jgi:hypothetical protein
LGGDIDIISGGTIACGAEEGGAETLRDLLEGNCLLGDLGEEAGEDREEALGLLRSAGLGRQEGPLPITASSSGSGPRVEPPLAELKPDIADTEF